MWRKILAWLRPSPPISIGLDVCQIHGKRTLFHQSWWNDGGQCPDCAAIGRRKRHDAQQMSQIRSNHTNSERAKRRLSYSERCAIQRGEMDTYVQQNAAKGEKVGW